ncbi:MAG: hypothetical protein HY867_17540 [Chloroflexi bacterium]|nr:hypothetical protein [Chloroflexota bacterium]
MPKTLSPIARILFSILFALALAAISLPQFLSSTYKTVDTAFLIAAPIVAFGILIWLALPTIFEHISHPLLLSGFVALPLALIDLCLIQRAFPAGWQQAFVTLVLFSFYSIFFHQMAERLMRAAKSFFTSLAHFALAGVFLVFDAGILALVSANPGVYHPEQFIPSIQNLPWILLGLLAGFAINGIILGALEKWGWLNWIQNRNWGERIEENLPGIFAAFTVCFGYFLLAHGFNPPVDSISLNNTFFASDTYFWQVRFGTEEGYSIGRAVHPLALLFMRGASSTLRLFLGGDWRLAALMLVAMTGAGCAFLLWRFIYNASGSASYALGFSGILAFSTAHLIFGSVTETYIFSAFGLLLFFVLLQKPERENNSFLFAGLLNLGITVSNVAQSLIGFWMVKRDGKQWFTFAMRLASLAVALTILTASIYPRAITFFFVPSDLFYETRHTGFVGRADSIPKRLVTLGKNLFLTNVVAVPPEVTVVDKAGRPPFPKLNFFSKPYGLNEFRSNRYQIAPFVIWVAALLFAFVQFFRKRKASPHFNFQATFLIILAFNFLLHINYGFDTFLYTPDWTYALILFVGLSLLDFKDRVWLNWTLAALLFSLVLANGVFLLTLTRILQPYLVP